MVRETISEESMEWTRNKGEHLYDGEEKLQEVEDFLAIMQFKEEHMWESR